MGLKNHFNDDLDYYQDRGCQYSPSCLTCKLEVCIEDDPLQFIKLEWAQRNTERSNAVALAQQTMSKRKAIAKAAKEYGVTERAVWRSLKQVGV